MLTFYKGEQMFVHIDTPPLRKLDFVNIEGQISRDENINIKIIQWLISDDPKLGRLMS